MVSTTIGIRTYFRVKISTLSIGMLGMSVSSADLHSTHINHTTMVLLHRAAAAAAAATAYPTSSLTARANDTAAAATLAAEATFAEQQ